MNDVKPVRQARYPLPKHVFTLKAATQNVKNLKNSKNSAESLLFLRNHRMSHFKGYRENGLRYQKSDLIFEILRKFPFRWMT